MKERITVALIYDFDGTLAPGNMQEYDFIPAVGKSNKEFWSEANDLAEEQEVALLTALDRLAPDERALVQLHYYENRPLSECSVILSLSETNTKVRLHRIRKKLGLWINEK